MILNTGGRTDTVQYFSEWLLQRFKEGVVFSRNPLFPGKVTRYELNPDKIDCVLFCSKNYAPILPRLHEISDLYRTYFFYTITAYGTDMEPGVPSIDESCDTLLALEKLVGRKKIVWRYDPVLLTKKYTVQKHAITFEHLCARLHGHVDRCVFSFVELYKKLQFNMPELCVPTDADLDALAETLGGIAQRYRIPLQTCASRADYSRYGISAGACVTLSALGKANGVHFRNLAHKGMRKNCGCMVSHDIGAYDTCINGCRYCYANQNPQKAKDNFRLYNPHSPILLGELKATDIIVPGDQRSFVQKPWPPASGQIPLF